jgi:phospholipid transport system substrate-binding protein
MLRRGIAGAALVGLLALEAAAGVPAAGEAAGPREQLRRSIDRMLVILQEPGLKGPAKTLERRSAMFQVVMDLFDFQEMGRRALGRHWGPRSPEEQAEFVPLFTDLIWRTYIDVVERYENEVVKFRGEAIRGGEAEVSTEISSLRTKEIAVDYRLLQTPDGWRVYDVSIQGVSLVGNYRTQLDRLILSKSYGEAIRLLRSKREVAEAEEHRKLRDSGM